ncbi:NAD dependent epimerase dehydratase family protein [Mycena indigotica]|uniref:NAD dependent epimerase dehydratase family protein n=1 Tax=Mycena indigotica TaxID=2126181 RepID=A0A8H6S973_9AGAR|nr:NAD dependent epimerase dehydratase family protein [Mycena indigotica]KAF7295281.1 NAD dependent epimerase dehydratase family protein [Mycena indigotica]
MSAPNVLIFGGLNTCSRALVSLLAPLEGEPLVSSVRIVDRFSVEPPTTYIGAEFPKILKQSKIVEYRQANLTVAATIAQMFDPPEGQAPYDYVFDFTGEVQFDRSEMIQIDRTCNVAWLLGLEAAKRKVKAYCRLSLPFYETSTKGSHDEKEDIKPFGVCGTWWHEALRMLADIEDLNLVILRSGFLYGPYTNWGIITSAITVSSVYGYMKKPMRSMWSPGKNPNNTIHTDDVAGAMWACAEWMAPLGRKEADSLAGEIIIFHNDKSKVGEVKGMPEANKKLVAPLFNLVDNSNSTLFSVGQTVTSFFGTTFEFFNFVENTVLNLKSDAVEDINEHHVSAWTEMITTSNPPIPNTPLSAYMDKYALDKHVVAFSNQKLLEVTGLGGHGFVIYASVIGLYRVPSAHVPCVRSTRRQLDSMDPNAEDYELLLPEQTQNGLPKRVEAQLPREGRKGDGTALYIAFFGIGLFATVSWVITLVNDPLAVGIFALHPLLQSLSLVLLVYGILTLQPTSQPKTKAAGLARHQYAIILVALPAIVIGTSAVWWNKERRGADHFKSWHGKFGLATFTWIFVQVLLGGGSVWFGGAAFGGGSKAKAVWKYHRLSGYVLFVLLMVTAHLGGFWSGWGHKYSPLSMRILAYAIGPLACVIGLYIRVRPSKMKFI